MRKPLMEKEQETPARMRRMRFQREETDPWTKRKKWKMRRGRFPVLVLTPASHLLLSGRHVAPSSVLSTFLFFIDDDDDDNDIVMYRFYVGKSLFLQVVCDQQATDAGEQFFRRFPNL